MSSKGKRVSEESRAGGLSVTSHTGVTYVVNLKSVTSWTWTWAPSELAWVSLGTADALGALTTDAQTFKFIRLQKQKRVNKD